MPKISCIQHFLDEMCLQFCDHVDECPAEAECYFRIKVRETIEDICIDDPERPGDEA